MLRFNDTQTIIHAFISSGLDYCNGLLTGINQKSINRLQIAQNAAEKREHISSNLTTLYWLPICFRIDFKILLITFKALHGLNYCHLTNQGEIPLTVLTSSLKTKRG